MTVALANPSPVNMPGYNNPDLDEVHSLPRYCSLLFCLPRSSQVSA